MGLNNFNLNLNTIKLNTIHDGDTKSRNTDYNNLFTEIEQERLNPSNRFDNSTIETYDVLNSTNDNQNAPIGNIANMANQLMDNMNTAHEANYEKNNANEEVRELVNEIVNSDFELENSQLVKLYSCATVEEAANIFLGILNNYYNTCFGFSEDEVNRVIKGESFESVFDSNYEEHIKVYWMYLSTTMRISLSVTDVNNIKNAGSWEACNEVIGNIQQNQLKTTLYSYGFSETDINRVLNGELTAEQLYEEIMTEEDSTRRYNMSVKGIFDSLVNSKEENLTRFRNLSENFDNFEEMHQFIDFLKNVRPLLIEDFFNNEVVTTSQCASFFKNYILNMAGSYMYADDIGMAIDNQAKNIICYYTYVDRNGMVQFSWKDPRIIDNGCDLDPDDYEYVKLISYYDILNDTEYYELMKNYIIEGDEESALNETENYYLRLEGEPEVQSIEDILNENQTDIEYLQKMSNYIVEETERYTYLELEYTRRPDFATNCQYSTNIVKYDITNGNKSLINLSEIISEIISSGDEWTHKDIYLIHMYMCIVDGTSVECDYEEQYILKGITNDELYFYKDFIEHEWYRFLTDTEKEIFYYICNTEGYSAGFDYLMKLDDFLDRRCYSEKTEEASEEATWWRAYGSTILLYGTFEGFDNLFYSIDCWLSGREMRLSETFSASDVWRSEYIAGLSSDGWRTFHNVSLTILDMIPTVVVAYLTKGTSCIGTIAANALRTATIFATMGVKTYSSTLNMALEAGLSDGSAILLAICSTAVEVVMENWSFSHLFGVKEALSSTTTSTIKSIATKIIPWQGFQNIFIRGVTFIAFSAKQGLIEVDEEICTLFANKFLEGLIAGDLSSYAQQMDYYIGCGYSESESAKMLGVQFKDELLETALTSFITGFIMEAGKSSVDLTIASKKISNNIISIYNGTNPGNAITQTRSDIRKSMISGDYTELIKNIMSMGNISIDDRKSTANNVIEILEDYDCIDIDAKTKLTVLVNGIASGTIDTNLNEQQISLDAVKLYDVDDMETTLELYPQHEQSLAEEVTPNLSIKQPEGYFYQPGDLVSEQEKLSDIITEKLFDADDMETTLELYPQQEQQISLDAVKLYDVDDMETIVDATNIVSNDEVVNINETPSINDSILTSIESLSMDERVEMLSSNTKLTLEEGKFIINSLSFEELSVESKSIIFENFLDLMTDKSIERILKTYPQEVIIYIIDMWFGNRDVPNAVVRLINSLSLENLDDFEKEVLVGNLAHLLEENLFNQIKDRITNPDAMAEILLKNNLLSSEYKCEIINSLSFGINPLSDSKIEELINSLDFTSLSNTSKKLILEDYTYFLSDGKKQELIDSLDFTSLSNTSKELILKEYFDLLNDKQTSYLMSLLDFTSLSNHSKNLIIANGGLWFVSEDLLMQFMDSLSISQKIDALKYNPILFGDDFKINLLSSIYEKINDKSKIIINFFSILNNELLLKVKNDLGIFGILQVLESNNILDNVKVLKLLKICTLEEIILSFNYDNSNTVKYISFFPLDIKKEIMKSSTADFEVKKFVAYSFTAAEINILSVEEKAIIRSFPKRISYTNIEIVSPFDEQIASYPPGYETYLNTDLPIDAVITDIKIIEKIGNGNIIEGLRIIIEDYGISSIQTATAMGTVIQSYISQNPFNSTSASNKEIAERVREVYASVGLDGMDIILDDEYETILNGLNDGSIQQPNWAPYWKTEKLAAELTCEKKFKSNFDFWQSNPNKDGMLLYTGSGYGQMNSIMRKSLISHNYGDAIHSNAISELSSQISQCDGFSERTIIYRGKNNLNYVAEGVLRGLYGKGLVDGINKMGGGIFTIGDNGFESSTPFLGGGFTDKQVIEVTSFPPQKYGSYIGVNSTCSGELEFLTQAGTGNKKIILGAELIGNQVFVYTTILEGENPIAMPQEESDKLLSSYISKITDRINQVMTNGSLEMGYYELLNIYGELNELDADIRTAVFTEVINNNKPLRKAISVSAIEELRRSLKVMFGIEDEVIINEVYNSLLGGDSFVENGIGAGLNWDRYIEIIRPYVKKKIQQMVNSGKEPIFWSKIDDEYHENVNKYYTNIGNTTIDETQYETSLTFINAVFPNWNSSLYPVKLEDLWAKLSTIYAEFCSEIITPGTENIIDSIKFIYPEGYEADKCFGNLFKSVEFPSIVKCGSIKKIIMEKVNLDNMNIIDSIEVNISDIIEYYRENVLNFLDNDPAFNDYIFDMFIEKIREAMHNE